MSARKGWNIISKGYQSSVRISLDDVHYGPISPGEKEMMQRVFEASDLRLKYCQGRILMEEAKLLDREGKHIESSQKCPIPMWILGCRSVMGLKSDWETVFINWFAFRFITQLGVNT